jgi:PIN domain nuclease of toxin-antitoxin system
MRILLDTSYLYNLVAAREQFSDAERLILTNQTVRIYVSAVSIWEMRLKFQARHGSGARKSRFDPQDVISALQRQDVTFLPMTTIHAAKSLEVPIPHRDPFDELLLVQAQEEGLKLATLDRLLVAHPLTVTPL